MSATYSTGKAILVVDDDPLLRELLADILVAEGFVVIEADSAKQALRQLEAFPDVRLLLTDIQMPGELDGLELVRIVRRRWPGVASIVTSGRILPRREEMPAQVRFISKPWRTNEMLRQVNELLTA
jgi:CheY-like chemotaxis protein